MPITTDELLNKNKKPAINAGIPSIDPSLTGAPPTVPGSGTGSGNMQKPQQVSPETSNQTGIAQTVSESVKETIGSEQYAQPKDKKLSYVELFKELSPYKPPTDEELEKERKKQKREAIFSAIGDGISALSNLYFTSQYAPNAYDPTKGMTATTKARFDKLKKDREDNQRQYMEGFLRATRWDDEDARDERNWRHTLEREKVTDRYKEAADARAQAKADRDEALAQLRMDLMRGKIDEQEAAAEEQRIKAEYADAYWQSRINKNNYRPVRGGSRSSGGSGRPAEYPWYDSDGNKHYAYSYEAMRQNSIDNGTWNEQTQESSTERTTKDRKGKTKGTTSSTTTKPAKGHSSAPEGKKPNPMGGGSSGNGGKQKKKNPMS